MVLGKLPVPGRPTYLDYSSARCVWVFFGHFILSVYHFSGYLDIFFSRSTISLFFLPLSLSLSLGDACRSSGLGFGNISNRKRDTIGMPFFIILPSS